MQFAEQEMQATTTQVSVNLDKQLPETMSNIEDYRARLKQLPEVQNLTNEISIQDANTIVSFGIKPSEELSKVSDELLNSMKGIKADEASAMLNQLTKIMDKFDIKEIEDPEKAAKQGGLTKIFKKGEESLQKLFSKYDNMGKEVDKVYVILNTYKSDIQKSNDLLSRLFKANIQYYEQLEKYIAAGELGLIEIDDYRNSLATNPNYSPDQVAMMEQKLDTMRNMLEQRIYELRIAENVSMQTAPMIQTMEKSNLNLISSIQSAFITTLPIFKNCLIQAIQLKQQAIQSKSIDQLRDKTNELWLRNAQNNATQSVRIAQQANQSTMNIQTLQQSHDTITQGIANTKAIEAQMAEERKQNTATLEAMKKDMRKEGWA